MTHCLSEAEVQGYLRGAVNEQQRSMFDENLRDCSNCAARVEQARGSKLDDQAPRAIQAATRLEAQSVELDPAHSSADSHWTDGGESEVVVERRAVGSISLEEFITGLSESGLLLPAEVAGVRERSHKDPASSTVAGLIEWLVNEHKLTRYQANILARGQRGGLVLGNYVILDKLGQGGMGSVFKARHRRMNRLVALKVLPQSLSSIPEAIARFQREVEAAARLQHPNIAAAYDADESSGVHFLVMEFVDGPTLATYVKLRGALPAVLAAKVIIQAARGLAAAHAQGIVHRDIKPSNIMIGRQGIVKVLDMGLAQVRGHHAVLEATAGVTRTGRVMGTVDYMSPEQARDAKNVDLRADVYSLGCTLFFLCTGKTPAPPGSAAEKLLWHQTSPPLSLSAEGANSSPQLDALVLRMMAKHVDQRPLSMHDIADELERCAEELPPVESRVLLDGLDEIIEHGASTLYGSNYGQATMHNLGDTIVSHAGRRDAQGSPRAGKSRFLRYAAGIGIALLAGVVAAPLLMNRGGPPVPPAENGTLIVSVAGEPAEVRVDRQLMGLTHGGGQPLELNVTPGSLALQVHREGYEPHEQRIEVRGGETERVEVTLRARRAAASLPGILPAQRDLLTWVFRNQGQVTVNSGVGESHLLAGTSALPPGPLRIDGIKLDGTGVRDADLAVLAAVPGLLELSLADTQITDEGLTHVSGLKRLQSLNLSKTQISSSGLAHLQRLLELTELNLERTAVHEGVLQHLKRLTSLEKLYLSDTKITDAALIHLKTLPSLKLLTLHGTGLTETTHAALEEALPELKIAWDGADVERAVALRLLAKQATLAVLDRAGTRQAGIATVESLPGGRILIKAADLSTAQGINDDDLQQLALLTDVEQLSLAGTKITRDGLLSLATLKKLRQLDLGTMQLPPAAVKSLRDALPECHVILREPADAQFARQVLAAGGQVSVQSADSGKVFDGIDDAAGLPANRFVLVSVKLDNQAAAGDALLERVGDLPDLNALYLANTGITDKGVERIAQCRKLKILGLGGAKISAAGIAALTPLHLEHLYLAHTEIGGEGIRRVGNLTSLTHLSLQGVRFADDDLASLKRLARLRWLDVSQSALGDASVAHLGGLKGLAELRVQGTALTDAGQEELRTALGGKCKVQGDPLNPQRLAARWLVENAATVSLQGDPGPAGGQLAGIKDLPRGPCRILAIDVAESTLPRERLRPQLMNCRDVVNLNLSSTRLVEADLEFLQEMLALRELRLTGLALSDRTFEYLAAHPALEVLDLGQNTRITGRGLSHLLAAKGLRQLLMANTQIDERYLPAIEGLEKLEALDLSAAPNLTDKAMDSIVKLKGLTMLGLRGAKITDAAAEKLATLSQLEKLDLEATRLSDTGVGNLKGLARLRHLSLANTQITDGAVPALSEMQQLTSLNLSRTKLTQTAIEALQKALPERVITPPTPLPRDPNLPAGADNVVPRGGSDF
jgi:serine/threonine protein kinase/Leucine-rich repeat (LRR) protein